MDNILELIRRENPDIIVMQEVYDGREPSWERKYRSMEVFRKELDYPYDAFTPGFLEVKPFGKIEQGNAIFSRFPITSHETIFGDRPYGERVEEDQDFENTPRNLQHATLNVNGTELHVFNTQGVWGEDGLDNPRRLAMGQAIADAVKDHDLVILAGDFNVQENTETIGKIETHLTNVFKGELQTSFNMKHKSNGGYATAVVDMIFVSPSLRILEKLVPKDDVSDHLPLLTILGF